jgi:hypothetical protein
MFWVEEQVLLPFKRADYVMPDYRMTVRFGLAHNADNEH